MEALKLFTKFNAIAVGRPFASDGEIRSKTAISAGVDRSDYAILRREKIKQTHGGVVTLGDFSSHFFKISFAETFDHEGCFKNLYSEYCRAVKDRKERAETVLNLLDLGSNAHLFRDGNGRAALLLTWFAQIFNNDSFLIAIDAYNSHPAILREAETWTVKFMDDPAISPLSQEAKEMLEKIKNDIILGAIKADPAAAFVSELVKVFYKIDSRHSIFFNFPIQYDVSWRVARSGHFSAITALPKDLVRSDPKDIFLTEINPKYLHEALEKCDESFFAEQNFEIINAKIANLLLQKFCQIPAVDLQECDAQLCHMVIARYLNSEALLDEKNENDFKAGIKSYLEKFPQQREKLFAILSDQQKEEIIFLFIKKEVCQELAEVIGEVLKSNVVCCGMLSSKGANIGAISQRENKLILSYDVGSRWKNKSFVELSESLRVVSASDDFDVAMRKNGKMFEFHFNPEEGQKLDYKSVEDYIKFLAVNIENTEKVIGNSPSQSKASVVILLNKDHEASV